MAIIFTIISMLAASTEDFFEKKAISSSTEDALKTLVWYGITNAILLCALLILGMDELTMMPCEVLLSKPIVLLTPAFSCLTLLFALIAYKYLGISERNSFVNVDGFFFIILLVLYHVLTGNADYATRLLSPFTLIGVTLIIIATIVYPYTKRPKIKDGSTPRHLLNKKPKTVLILGMSISFISALFDGTESLVSSVLIGDDIVDSLDYIATLLLVQFILAMFVWIYLWIRNKKPYNPFQKTEKYRYISQSFSILADLLYVFALSDDALLGVILWNVFPVLDIVSARIFMKEKLTWFQYLMLFMIIVGAVLISIS